MEWRLTLWTFALGLASSASCEAQDRPVSWRAVAGWIGGSGTAKDDRYVRLMPSRAWGDATPPAWVEFRREEEGFVLRGTVPVERDEARAAEQTMRKFLPGESAVAVHDTFGAESKRVHVRYRAVGHPHVLASALFGALEQVEPGLVDRIDTLGVVEKDSFECEDGYIVRTVDGEMVNIGLLSERFQKAGMAVRVRATRKRFGAKKRCYYYGVTGAWRTTTYGLGERRGTLEAVDPLPEPPAESRREGVAWIAACRSHARSVLEREVDGSERVWCLARGFEAMEDRGFAVCPLCQRRMVEDSRFQGGKRDGMNTSLQCCARSGAYFVSCGGVERGPFFPLSEPTRSAPGSSKSW